MIVCFVLLLFTAGSTDASQDLSDVAVRDLIEKGRYTQEAEKLAAEWAGKAGDRFGAESLEAARALDSLVETLIRNGKGAASTTLALSERAVLTRNVGSVRRIPNWPSRFTISDRFA